MMLLRTFVFSSPLGTRIGQGSSHSHRNSQQLWAVKIHADLNADRPWMWTISSFRSCSLDAAGSGISSDGDKDEERRVVERIRLVNHIVYPYHIMW